MPTLTFTLRGDTPSKKNSQRGVIRGGKYYRIPSRQHEAWHTRAGYELKAQMRNLCKSTQSAAESMQFPIAKCAITMRFWSSTLRRFDLDNRATSTLDLLVDVGVIVDDDWFHVPELLLLYAGMDRQNPRVEIEIEQIRQV